MTKDEGMQRYIQFVQKLIDEDLVDAKTPNWSDVGTASSTMAPSPP